MDDQLKEVITNLAKFTLPDLHRELKGIIVGKKFEGNPSDSLKTALESIVPQFVALSNWVEPSLLSSLGSGQSSSPGDDHADISGETTSTSEDSSEVNSADDDGEAAKMLAAMDDDDGTDDDDAAKMLAAMDDDDGTDEDEAAKMLAELEGDSSGDDADNIDDDEAARLLAEMEGGSDEGESDNIDDDEAARLLAEMEGGGDTSDGDGMADDEAARLLADMEDGPSDSDAPTESATTKAVVQVEEIPEWEANEFQDDPEMMVDFQNNTAELMDVLDEQILNLEGDPNNKEVIEEIFRAAHTLKGAGGMFGFKGLERVMHRTENLFDLIRKGKLQASSDVVDVVLEAFDVLKELLAAVNEGKPCGVKTAPIVMALEAVANGEKAPKAAAETAETVEGASAGSADDGAGKPAAKKKSKDVSTIRVDLARLDALVNLVGELVIDRTRFVHVEEQLRSEYPQLGITGNMTETLQLFGRHMNEVQDIIMKVRMVPIGNAFNKFPRLVRDLAKSLDKKIDLFVSGENAELDKTLVEQIGDPLIHLIRNACDHGVETPAARAESGKAENGSVFLSAQQEGNSIAITIKDDGKGMPVEILRKKGIEKGLISDDDNLSDKDIFNLIFEPGFSTAEKVTNVSGRGVGMDVVKKQIQKLKGMIEIDSVWGQGSTIKIQLPLTLAIVQSLLVESENEMFAIPLNSVIESLRIHPSEIQRVGDAEVVKIRDQVLPLVHLSEVMNLSTRKSFLPYMMKQNVESIQAANERMEKRKRERLYVVVVGTADKRYGVVVDQLLNQQEMVIKSMGPFMKEIPCVAGGAVLGHGEVVLVLDVAELISAGRAKARQIASAA